MEMESVKKHNTKTIILIIIGALIALLIAGGVYYKLKVVGDPVTLTTIALEELGESLEDENTYGKLASFLADNDIVELNMTGNVTMPMDMGTINLDMMMQEDVEKKEAVMDLDVKLNGENAIYLEGQLDKDALYFAFKENASKYYYLTDLKYPDEMAELDIDSFLDKFIESFKESVKKDDFVESEKEITVNTEKIKTKQYSLKLTNELTKTIMEKFFVKIENDKELIKDLTTLTEMTEEEIKESFDEMIENITSSEESENLYYNIYVYKNTAVRYEITDSEAILMMDDYKNKEMTFKVIDSSEENLKLSIKEDKNEWKIDFSSTDLNVTGSIAEEKYDLTLTADDVNVKISGTNDYKEVNDGIEATLKGNVSMEQQGTTLTVPYEFNINLKEIKKVTLKDTTNKVDINNMTTEEENEFNTELSEIPLMSLLMSNTLEDTTEYDYNDTDEYGYGYGY